MGKDASKSRRTIAPLAGVLAWLVPGAGHWYLGRRVRAAILFAVIQALFWSGLAVGGVFTVNPRDEAWWWRAQMCTGLSGLAGYQRQASWYTRIESTLPPAPDRAFRSRREYEEHLARRRDMVDAELAKMNLALVPPASDVAYILSGVAGMLNLMCIFDAVLLSLMGRYGEPQPARPQEAQEARA